jgi:putative ABC transport system permease protein
VQVSEIAPQSRLVARLALRDYLHEWIMSGCFVLALAAVLVPLLVLFGLKYGIITNLLDPLIEDPRYREIVPSGSGSYGPDWFATLNDRNDVAFAIPRTRMIAATMKLQAPQSDVGRIIDVELIPSGPADPALGPETANPKGYGEAVLSADAAAKLRVAAGDRVEGVLTRTRQGRAETVRVPLNVAAVAGPGAFQRDGMFVALELLVAVEDFLDGRAVPALDWGGSAPRGGDRRFAGFRVYAATIDAVAPLREEFLDQGIDVRTRAADIELVRTLDRNLSIVYWIIALLAVGGYCLSFGASVWANVDRKRREFSVLRLTGFRTRDIVWFPVLQAALTGLSAWIVATLSYYVVAGLLNALFLTNVGGGQPVCRLQFWHLLVALVMTLAAAVLAASLGGVRVAQMEPSLGLRDS